jgi:hypothetical protein
MMRVHSSGHDQVLKTAGGSAPRAELFGRDFSRGGLASRPRKNT